MHCLSKHYIAELNDECTFYFTKLVTITTLSTLCTICKSKSYRSQGLLLSTIEESEA